MHNPSTEEEWTCKAGWDWLLVGNNSARRVYWWLLDGESRERAGEPTVCSAGLTRLTPNAPAVYDAVLKQIQQQYVLQPVDNAKLFYGAVSGLVRSLGDPYSTFFTPEAATAFKNDLDLSIEGIGAEIGYKEKRPAIIAPLPSSPAEKIGLKAGDFLLTVDERDVTALTIDEIVGYIRGKAGTKVTITVDPDCERTFVHRAT